MKGFTFGDGDFFVEPSERVSPKNHIVTPSVWFGLSSGEGGGVSRAEIRKLIDWLNRWLEETKPVDKKDPLP
jgi:hypothetical protein